MSHIQAILAEHIAQSGRISLGQGTPPQKALKQFADNMFGIRRAAAIAAGHDPAANVYRRQQQLKSALDIRAQRNKFRMALVQEVKMGSGTLFHWRPPSKGETSLSVFTMGASKLSRSCSITRGRRTT